MRHSIERKANGHGRHTDESLHEAQARLEYSPEDICPCRDVPLLKDCSEPSVVPILAVAKKKQASTFIFGTVVQVAASYPQREKLAVFALQRAGRPVPGRRTVETEVCAIRRLIQMARSKCLSARLPCLANVRGKNTGTRR